MAREPLRRILYVDDEISMRTIVQVALGDVGGFELRACPGGEEALSVVAGFAPQLILLDVMMPGMSGPDLLAKLRARADTAGVPVVFLTAIDDERELRGFLALGVEKVIRKPIDPATLADTVRGIWNGIVDPA